MSRTLIAIVALVTVSSGLAFADREQRQDRKELAQDHRETNDDRFDYVRLRSLLTRFDQARAANNVPQLQALEVELDGLLAEELRESRHELAKDSAEASRSQREVNRDRRNGKRAADDRRDRNDDVRDANVEAYHLQQKRVIAAELASVARRQDAAALGYRRERIVRLIALGGQELREDAQEKKEDRRERREDRRRPR